MTWASMLRALSQRANQKPSRPPWKETTMRSILHPAFSASSRHRYSSLSNALSSTAIFFNGWRSMPGTIPATSQLDRLISMTAINVLAGLRAMRDRLKSFNVCMGSSIGSQRRWMQYPRRRPIASSIMGVENEAEQSFGRPCCQTNGRSKRPSEPTSSIVPRRTYFHRRVELKYSPMGCYPVRASSRCDLPGPTELGAINPDAVHDHSEPACQRHDRLFLPAVSGDLHRPGFEPRPPVGAGQHDLGCFVKHHPHHFIAAARYGAGPISFTGLIPGARQSEHRSN